MPDSPRMKKIKENLRKERRAMYSRRYRAAKRKAARAAKIPVTQAHKELMYKVLTDNGPDVEMYSRTFNVLVGKALRAGAMNTESTLYNWLDEQGYFGRKSDKLRTEGNKYYPAH